MVSLSESDDNGIGVIFLLCQGSSKPTTAMSLAWLLALDVLEDRSQVLFLVLSDAESPVDDDVNRGKELVQADRGDRALGGDHVQERLLIGGDSQPEFAVVDKLALVPASRFLTLSSNGVGSNRALVIGGSDGSM